MKSLFDYIKSFPFKNVLAMPLIWYLLHIMEMEPSLHDSCIVLLTLVVKYFYDSSNSSAAKDATISKALTVAQNTPGTPTVNADSVDEKG